MWRRPSYWSRVSPEQPASYIIYKDEFGYICAKNGKTGKIDYRDEDAATVIQQAIDALKTQPYGVVALKPDIYDVESTITLYSGIGLIGLMPGFATPTEYHAPTVIRGKFNDTILKIVANPNQTFKAFPFLKDIGIVGSGDSADSSNDGIFIDNSQGTINDVVLERVFVFWCGGKGLKIQNGGKHWIRTCYFESCKRQGIYVGNSARLTCYGSYIYGNGDAGTSNIQIDAGGFFVFTDNVIDAGYGHGLLMRSITKGIIIKGNLFLNNGEVGGQAHIYVNGGVTGLLISNNLFIDDRSPTKTEYGIYITNTNGDNDGLIYLNKILNVATAKIYFAVSQPNVIVRNNQGYITENSGVATIPAGSTSVTVSHGLASAPKNVKVTPIGDPGDRWWVANVGDMSFDIVVASAPTADISFYWEAEM